MGGSVRVRVELAADGTAVAVKSAVDDAGEARLAVEAELLRRFAGPGVVELLGWDPETGCLATRYASGGSLTGGPLGPMRSIRALADAATGLQRLHTAGLRHGRIRPDHILVTDTGGALTGLAEATGGSPSDDVAALAALARAIVDAPLPAGRSRGRDVPDAAALDLALTRALDPACTAAAFAESLAAAVRPTVPADDLAALRRTIPPRPSRSGAAAAPRFLLRLTDIATALRRRPVLLASGAAATALAVLAALAAVHLLGGRGDAVPRAGAVAATSVPTGATATSPDTTSPATAIPATATPATAIAATAIAATAPPASAPPAVSSSAATAATVPGSVATQAGERVWPTDPTTIAPSSPVATVFARDGRDVELHTDPSDTTVLGDFDCDGIATPAVLRLASGAIDVFTTWPSTDQPTVTARRVATMLDAVGLEVDLAGRTDGCARLMVVHEDGARTEVSW